MASCIYNRLTNSGLRHLAIRLACNLAVPAMRGCRYCSGQRRNVAGENLFDGEYDVSAATECWISTQ